jgi:hypothetical protein
MRPILEYVNLNYFFVKKLSRILCRTKLPRSTLFFLPYSSRSPPLSHGSQQPKTLGRTLLQQPFSSAPRNSNYHRPATHDDYETTVCVGMAKMT